MLLTQAEEAVLDKLDRLADLPNPPASMAITKNQFNALRRILKKQGKEPISRRGKPLSISETHYRGIEYYVFGVKRRRRKLSDMMDFIE